MNSYGTVIRTTAAGVLLLLLLYSFNKLHAHPDYGSSLAFALAAGALFGVVLQRSRFCFFCILKDFFEKKDGRPLIGIVTALIVGSIGYLVLFESWISNPQAGYYPMEAHIGPVSWHLILGGLLFGWGMVLSGSCISAHFYRLGEGSVLSPIALAGTLFGFMLGLASWNRLYRLTISDAPVVWLPEYLGYSGSLYLQLALLLTLLVWLIVKFIPEDATASNTPARSLKAIYNRVFVDRWPTWIGGIGVGLISIFYYFRVEPLGVTAEINRVARLSGWSAIPDRLEGMDGLAGCTPNMGPELFTANGLFILALIAGATLTGVLAGQFKPKRPGLRASVNSFLGGIMLGFGAMISLGCTIGATLSGIHAFALSGWIFTIGMVFGVWSGLKVKR